MVRCKEVYPTFSNIRSPFWKIILEFDGFEWWTGVYFNGEGDHFGINGIKKETNRRLFDLCNGGESTKNVARRILKNTNGIVYNNLLDLYSDFEKRKKRRSHKMEDWGKINKKETIDDWFANL